MVNTKKIKIDKFKLQYFRNIKKIYENSFPKEERFPIIILLLNIIRKNSELFVELVDEKVISFIYIIKYRNERFILYLAVDKEKRNNGFGGYLLNWYMNNHKNSNIYLNIDEVDGRYDDNIVRNKRLNFYLSKGFFLTEYLSIEKSGNYNILLNSNKYDEDKYKELDSKISHWFFNKKSIIERKTK